MNNPNPLVPQGSLLEQKARGKSNLFIAVFTILAIHVVLFAGLLMQGCGRKKPAENEAAKIEQTNSIVADTNTLISAPQPLAPAGTNVAYHTEPLTNVGAAPVDAVQPAVTPTNQFEAAAKPEDSAAAAAGTAKEYKVAKGDLFYTIAKSHGISISALKAANPSVDPKKLKVGTTLQIPAPAAAAASAAAPAGKAGSETAAAATADAKTYTVKAGDTLTKIAKTSGASVKDLRAVNGLKTDRLHVGQKIKLPAKAHAAN